MKDLYIRWLLFRGYKPYKRFVVSWTWQGEDPPLFGYYPGIILRKGLSTKEVKLKKLRFESLKDVKDMAKKLFDELVDQCNKESKS